MAPGARVARRAGRLSGGRQLAAPRSRIPLGGSLSEMDEQLRLVAGSEPPAAALAETASFEVFVTKSQTQLFGSVTAEPPG